MINIDELYNRLAGGVSAEELSNEFQNALKAAQKKQQEDTMQYKISYAREIIHSLIDYFLEFHPEFAEMINLNYDDDKKEEELTRALIPILDSSAKARRRGHSITYDFSDLFNLFFN